MPGIGDAIGGSKLLLKAGVAAGTTTVIAMTIKKGAKEEVVEGAEALAKNGNEALEIVAKEAEDAAKGIDNAVKEVAENVAPTGGGIGMRWKNLPTEARKAVSDVMIEFGSGPDGAKKLLEQVRTGARPKPSTISEETLRVYRDFVQNKYDELSKLRQDKNIDVMRDRLEIYRLWLGE